MARKAYSEQEREQVRTALLTTVIQCIVDRGLIHSSIDVLCKKVGISKTFFYTFFPSKEELVLEALRYQQPQLLEYAQQLMDTFTGLKIKELEWFENPREKTLKNGKPRVRRAKWLPEQEVDLVYLYSDHYLDAREPTTAETDFFTVTRMDAWGVSTWFMCTPQAAKKLIAMDYDNLAVQETTIVG